MPDEKVFFIRFYRTSVGTEPVREFLRGLPKEARSKCGQYMQRFEWEGFALAAQYLRKIEDGIWELRPEYNGIEYRLFFGNAGREAVFVHAVVKKQQKAERSDIALAMRRFNEWKAAQG